MQENSRALYKMYLRALDCAWLDGRNYAFHTGDDNYHVAIEAACEFMDKHAGAMLVRIEYSSGRWVFVIEEAGHVCTAGALIT